MEDLWKRLEQSGSKSNSEQIGQHNPVKNFGPTLVTDARGIPKDMVTVEVTLKIKRILLVERMDGEKKLTWNLGYMLV